jgi:hypothetical protein
MERSKGFRARAAASAAVAAILLAALLPGALRFAAERGETPGADAPAYVRIARTLLDTGSLVLPGPERIAPDSQRGSGTIFGTPWALSRDGRLLPKHSWLFALFLRPGVAAAGPAGAACEGVLLGAALAAFVTWRVSRDFGGLPAALAALAIFWAQPAGRWTAGAVNIDVAIAFLFVASLAFAADGHPVAAGILAGVAPLLRPTAPLLFLALPFVVLSRRRPGEMVRLAAGAAPGLLLFGAANTLMFGAPWITAYQRAALWDGRSFQVASVAERFGGALLPGLKALFLDSGGGLVFTAPVTLLALLGLALPEVRSAERIAAMAAALLVFVALAGYAFVRETAITNYRFAFPLAAASVAPLAGLLAAASRRGARDA